MGGHSIDRFGRNVQEGGRSHRAGNYEDYLIRMIEQKDSLKKYAAQIEKMSKGTLDVPGFLREASTHAVLRVVEIMEDIDTPEKIRLEAAKDILDRAGFGRTSRLDVSGGLNIDHSASKIELINMIMSMANKVGVRQKEVEELPGEVVEGETE